MAPFSINNWSTLFQGGTERSELHIQVHIISRGVKVGDIGVDFVSLGNKGLRYWCC